MNHYEITQADVDATRHYMKVFYPDSAEKDTNEYCLAFLEHLQSQVQVNLAELAKDPAMFEEEVSKFDQTNKA